MFLLYIILIVNIYFLVSSWFALQQLKFAKSVLQDIDNLHSAGIISTIQANVFLNDLTNPFDRASIIEVKRELDRIVQLEYAKSKSTNR